MASRQANPRHMYCFVPETDVDIVVLACYLKTFIDATATIRPSKHPSDETRLGFTVGAGETLNRTALEDVIADTKDWWREQQADDFLRSPYDYQDSDVWETRKRRGRTQAKKPALVSGRRDRVSDRNLPSRHDPRNPATFTEIESSLLSNPPSSIFSRDGRSQFSGPAMDEIEPSDSVSQRGSVATNRHGEVQKPRGGGGAGGGRGGGRGGGGNQPDPDAFSVPFSRMNIDNTRSNQSVQRTQTGSVGRHDADPKDDNKPGNQYTSKSSDRKESLDPYRR